MRLKTMQAASRLIQACNGTPLFSHVQTLAGLQIWLKNQLPRPLNEHCQVVNLRDGTLILGASSPVWATRLRYLAPQLGIQMGQKTSGKPLKVKIKVLAPTLPPGARANQRASISTATGKLLEQIAADIRHPDLSTALVRVAAHARKI